MKTREELERELAQAAERLREVAKAAKDLAARQTAEPPDAVRPLPGLLSPPNRPTPQGR